MHVQSILARTLTDSFVDNLCYLACSEWLDVTGDRRYRRTEVIYSADSSSIADSVSSPYPELSDASSPADSVSIRLRDVAANDQQADHGLLWRSHPLGSWSLVSLLAINRVSPVGIGTTKLAPSDFGKFGWLAFGVHRQRVQ